MKLSSLALCAAAALGGLAACATDDSPPGDGGDDGEDAPPFTNGVSTLSGRAEAGYADGPRGVATFANPVNVVYANGQIYVADFDNSKLRVVDAETGETSTLIDQMNFRRPFGLVVAATGTFYAATDDNAAGGHDGRSGTIWKIDVGAKTATVVAENIGRARGMAVLGDGKIAFTDYQAHTINLLDPATKQVTVIAGSLGQAAFADGVGGAARFNQPYGIVERDDGTLLVADQLNNRLRVVTLDGTVTTLAGSAGGYTDGAVATAALSLPQGLAAASNGDVYITDTGNYRVRRLQGGSIDTVAGSGEGGYLDSDDKLAAKLFGLEGMSLMPDGSKLFLADGGRGEAVPYNRIRSVKM